MDQWLTTDEAAARLGVRPQTLYAYVSRGLLDRRVGGDGRRSEYPADQVERLARRGRPRVATLSVPPVDVPIRTSIAAVDDGVFTYRGTPVVDLVEQLTFEEVLGLLWTGLPQRIELAWDEVDRSHVDQAQALTGAPTVFDRLAAAVISSASDDPMRYGRDHDDVVRTGARLIAVLVAAAGGDVRPGPAGAAARLATSLRAGAGRKLPVGRLTSFLEAALVLLADHELATSTMAVRVAASTRADPSMAVVAGLATLSGPLHGTAGRAAHALMRSALEFGPAAAVRDAMRDGHHLPGFGHIVYRHEDPRAEVLLARLASLATDRAWRTVEEVVRLGREQTRTFPNVDFALGATTATLGLVPDTIERLFAVARSGGWIAHVLEEYSEPPLRFRPRRMGVAPVSGRTPSSRQRTP